ncbi:hypothetical protein [Edaphobacter aggregans]|uniref:hypothetical protein n=1 Tax=Edaphobacter aggregans TaxID=570835 RepID=UPI000557E552|nr:hypothetical protein [Edaphobacter aggregans]
MKIISQYRQQARLVYYGALSRKEIPAPSDVVSEDGSRGDVTNTNVGAVTTPNQFVETVFHDSPRIEGKE